MLGPPTSPLVGHDVPEYLYFSHRNLHIYKAISIIFSDRSATEAWQQTKDAEIGNKLHHGAQLVHFLHERHRLLSASHYTPRAQSGALSRPRSPARRGRVRPVQRDEASMTGPRPRRRRPQARRVAHPASQQIGITDIFLPEIHDGLMIKGLRCWRMIARIEGGISGLALGSRHGQPSDRPAGATCGTPYDQGRHKNSSDENRP